MTTLSKQYNNTQDKQKEKRLNSREKEHFRNMRYQCVDKSALPSHVWIENHEIQKRKKIIEKY